MSAILSDPPSAPGSPDLFQHVLQPHAMVTRTVMSGLSSTTKRSAVASRLLSSTPTSTSSAVPKLPRPMTLSFIISWIRCHS